jgi:hypothetical protein
VRRRAQLICIGKIYDDPTILADVREPDYSGNVGSRRKKAKAVARKRGERQRKRRQPMVTRKKWKGKIFCSRILWRNVASCQANFIEACTK